MTNFRRKALRRIGLILMPLVLFGAEYGLPQANAAEPAAASTLPSRMPSPLMKLRRGIWILRALSPVSANSSASSTQTDAIRTSPSTTSRGRRSSKQASTSLSPTGTSPLKTTSERAQRRPSIPPTTSSSPTRAAAVSTSPPRTKRRAETMPPSRTPYSHGQMMHSPQAGSKSLQQRRSIVWKHGKNTSVPSCSSAGLQSCLHTHSVRPLHRSMELY